MMISTNASRPIRGSLRFLLHHLLIDLEHAIDRTNSNLSRILQGEPPRRQPSRFLLLLTPTTRPGLHLYKVLVIPWISYHDAPTWNVEAVANEPTT